VAKPFRDKLTYIADWSDDSEIDRCVLLALQFQSLPATELNAILISGTETRNGHRTIRLRSRLDELVAMGAVRRSKQKEAIIYRLGHRVTKVRKHGRAKKRILEWEDADVIKVLRMVANDLEREAGECDARVATAGTMLEAAELTARASTLAEVGSRLTRLTPTALADALGLPRTRGRAS
jgi:hypothetical protein